MSETGSVITPDLPEPEDESLAVGFRDNVKISNAEAKRAIKQAGLTGIKMREIIGQSVAGKWLQERGIMRIGQIYALQNIQEITELQAAIAADVDAIGFTDIESRTELRKVQKDLAGNKTHAIGVMIKSCVEAESEKATAAGLVPMAEPRQVVTPQVVVNVNQPTPEPKQVVDVGS